MRLNSFLLQPLEHIRLCLLSRLFILGVDRSSGRDRQDRIYEEQLTIRHNANGNY